MKCSINAATPQLLRGSLLGKLCLLGIVSCVVTGCSREDEGCAWGRDAALQRVGVSPATDPVDCGLVVVPATDDIIRDLYDCVDEAPTERGARLTLQRCFDCIDLTVAVKAPGSAEHYAVEQVSERTDGTPPHLVRVSRCDSLVPENGTLACVGAEELYTCAEPSEEEYWGRPLSRAD